jgi:hypothetical protein
LRENFKENINELMLLGRMLENYEKLHVVINDFIESLQSQRLLMERAKSSEPITLLEEFWRFDMLNNQHILELNTLSQDTANNISNMKNMMKSVRETYCPAVRSDCELMRLAEQRIKDYTKAKASYERTSYLRRFFLIAVGIVVIAACADRFNLFFNLSGITAANSAQYSGIKALIVSI